MSHKYRISSSKHPRHLFNVEALRGGAYQRVALERRRRLFEKRGVIQMKFENFVTVSFQITLSSNYYDIYQSYIFQLLVIYIAAMYIYICSICILS